MRVFISVDIEGVAGVCEVIQGQRGNPEYEYARRLMTDEASAAVRGAFNGGATEVVVADSHGHMRNILAGEIDQRARVVSGAPRPHGMVQGIDSTFDALVLVGYHAAGGNVGALAHTYSGRTIMRLEINGITVGETELFAGYAAELGVPLVATSGDDLYAKEVQKSFPNTTTVIVKDALGALATNSLSPSKACKLIERQVANAVSQSSEFSAGVPLQLPLAIVARLTQQIFADAIALLPFIERDDAVSVKWHAASYEEAIKAVQAISYLANGVR